MINLQKLVARTGGREQGDTFSGFHPSVNLLYFVLVIGFTMFFSHPVCLGISLLSAFFYSVYLNGRKALRFSIMYMLPMLIVTALLNPAFNHQGGTILTYLPDGNPLTLESVLYGLSAAVMLIAVIAWFSCFNEVMTSDKFVYLFGRVIPALSLILSMALRFVPRFRAQIGVISQAQKAIGRDASSGSLLQKMKHGVKILSIMVTWALENAIETADSMKGRGYGLPGRTAFSIYRFDRRDAFALLYLFATAGVVVAGAALGAYRFRYFPTIRGEWTGVGAILVFASYLALCIFPLIANIKEDLVWRSI
ncbi:MAG: energy-coupling factor transporter transmembrane protein EcfT [Clostridiales bacterium]|nr:energy-coupling factor transporter transmembrane protein EcfT [Clostridiales bacterium]